MSKIVNYGVLFIFLFFFIFIFFSKRKLKSNYRLSNATVTSVGESMSKNGNWSIEYRYVTDQGRQMKGTEFHPVLLPNSGDLINRSIPVAYSRENPEINQLLIYEHTWRQYGLKYPDSLQWLSGVIKFEKVIYSY